MKIIYSFIIFLFLIQFLVSIYFFDYLPEKIASHWNEKGEVNGYLSKIFFIITNALSIFILIIFLLIPKIDPLKENIEKFRKYYDAFVFILLFFLFYIFILTILWNLGFVFNIFLFILPLVSLLFYFCGILIENAKRNWFVGIRTPWTLSSEKVWDKTHKLGGKMFKISSLICMVGVLFLDYAIFFVLTPVIVSLAYLIFYSYFEFTKENKKIHSKNSKCQVSIEFIIIVCIFLFGIIISINAAWNNILNIQKSARDHEANMVLNLIANRLDIAYMEGDGFSISLNLPSKINGLDFEIEILFG
ncbi:MAG: SdpI family protein [Candidatus Nanoarchaeia archaeon]